MPPKKKKPPPSETWEWKNDEGEWLAFNAADAKLLEEKWEATHHLSHAWFTTSDFSFNKGFSTVYKVDLGAMTQTNTTSGVQRDLRRGGEGGGKKPKLAPGTWEWQDGKKWVPFASEDVAMLEHEFVERGPAAQFDTKSFSFNKEHGSLYRLNFGKMTQENTQSGKSRKIRRVELAAGAASSSSSSSAAAKPKWQWWDKEAAFGDRWQTYEAEDAATLEKAHASGKKLLVTKDLSFNVDFGTEYVFDFLVMSQINTDTGTSRAIRRGGTSGVVFGSGA